VANAKAVTVAQLRDFHARFYGAANAQFGASGDMDVAAVRYALDAAFGAWNSATPYTRVSNPLVSVKPKRFMIRAERDDGGATGAAANRPRR
jgi:zinc protease